MFDSLFNKVSGMKACNFIKTRLQHRFFPVNIGTSGHGCFWTIRRFVSYNCFKAILSGTLTYMMFFRWQIHSVIEGSSIGGEKNLQEKF